MPELPEVETTRRGIAPHIRGQKVRRVIVRNASLRWPIPGNLGKFIVGERIVDITRRGKYLLFQFESGTVLAHLGMSGSFRICKLNTAASTHDHVDLVFDNCLLRYHDPRRFGSILWAANNPHDHPLLTDLGPEPLTDDFNGDYLFAKSRKRKQGIKTFIMDSHIVVGAGNIYANEALFHAGIHPLKAAGKLSRANCEQLSQEIKKILSYAIERGGTTLRDFVGGDGKPGYFAQELSVYGRGGEPCVHCGKRLREVKLSQRATVYCTNCQK